jgi:glucan phosphoethanolaminetransferase (alkaline phosphatase superfamily)
MPTNRRPRAKKYLESNKKSNVLAPAIWVVVNIALLAALAISVSSLNDVDITKWTLPKVDIINLIGLAAAVMGLFGVTLSYLNRDRQRFEASSYSANSAILRYRELKEELKNLREMSSANLGEEDKNKIQSAIREQIDSFSTGEVLELIKSKLRVELGRDAYIGPIEQSIIRMKQEISSLESRGNLNLAIGIVTTIIGIIVLAVFVFTANYHGAKFNEIIAHFVPRVSLVIFVQIFSFFFLKLYRTNLSEIKYYNDRITSSEAMKSAIIMASSPEASDDTRNVINQLSTYGRIDSGSDQQVGEDLNKSIEMFGKFAAAISPMLHKS